MLQPKPKWIVVGGCWLAFLSAAVNAVFLVRFGTSVSHLTGDVARFAVDAVNSGEALSLTILNLLSAALGFVAGAAIAGYTIHHPSLALSRPYGRTIIAIGSCLLIAHFALEPAPTFAIFLAGLACGLQNALATRYRGMILRTTHVTGLLTDLGSTAGMILRGHQIALWKVGVPACLVASFALGAGFGAVLLLHGYDSALLLPAIIYIVGGVVWSIYKHFLAGPVPPDTPDEMAMEKKTEPEVLAETR